jgi:hypothetical protein
MGTPRLGRCACFPQLRHWNVISTWANKFALEPDALQPFLTGLSIRFHRRHFWKLRQGGIHKCPRLRTVRVEVHGWPVPSRVVQTTGHDSDHGRCSCGPGKQAGTTIGTKAATYKISAVAPTSKYLTSPVILSASLGTTTDTNPPHKCVPVLVNLLACLVGMEACAGAHYPARELDKLGHTVRLMSPHFVTPYRKSQRTMAMMRLRSVARSGVPQCGLCQSRVLSALEKRTANAYRHWRLPLSLQQQFELLSVIAQQNFARQATASTIILSAGSTMARALSGRDRGLVRPSL